VLGAVIVRVGDLVAGAQRDGVADGDGGDRVDMQAAGGAGDGDIAVRRDDGRGGEVVDLGDVDHAVGGDGGLERVDRGIERTGFDVCVDAEAIGGGEHEVLAGDLGRIVVVVVDRARARGERDVAVGVDGHHGDVAGGGGHGDRTLVGAQVGALDGLRFVDI